MLLGPEAGRAAELLDASDFYRTAHQKVFQALVALHRRDGRADNITLAAELRRRDDLEVVGGAAAIAQILEYATTTANLEPHAADVRRAAVKRRLARLGLDLQARAADGTQDAESILALLGAEAAAVAARLDAAGRRGVVVTRLSEVPPRRLSWLWLHRVPLGMVTILAGDGGLGKTTVALDLTARVTRGRPMPDGSEGLGEPAGVVVLSSEDAVDCVLVPRLTLAGADLERVATVGVKTAEGEERRLVVTPEDLVRLEDAVREVGARLVIFDPLAAYVDEEANLHHNQDARRVLARLHALAERLTIAVLGIHHFNRGQHHDAVHRLTGSAGIANAARSVLVVGPEPDEPSGERMVLAVAKRNLAPRSTPSLAYRLDVPAGEEHPVVAWQGPCAATANDLVAVPTDPEERSTQDDAVSLLRELLGAGPMLAKDVEREMRGTPERARRKAKRVLGVVSQRQDPHDPKSPWLWSLPERDTGEPAHLPATPYTPRPPVHLSEGDSASRCEPTTQDTRTDGRGQADAVRLSPEERARGPAAHDDEPPLDQEPPGWLQRPRRTGREGESAGQVTALSAAVTDLGLSQAVERRLLDSWEPLAPRVPEVARTRAAAAEQLKLGGGGRG